jgi:hypothetical protein
MLLEAVRVFVQHPSQLSRLCGEEYWDRAGQAACAPERGAADGPGTRHRRRHVILTEEGRRFHLLGGQRYDLQLELEVAFGGGADRPAVRAADDFIFAAFSQRFEEGAVLVRHSAGLLHGYQFLLDAEKENNFLVQFLKLLMPWQFFLDVDFSASDFFFKLFVSVSYCSLFISGEFFLLLILTLD